MKITVYNKSNLPTADFLEFTELQRDFKDRTQTQIERLARRIVEAGFKYPYFTWVDNDIKYIIDAHGRTSALNYLKNQGYEIPEIPYVEIFAENKEQAEKEILYLNSNYGTINKESVFFQEVFIPEIDVNVNIPDIEILDFEVEARVGDKGEAEVSLQEKFIIPPFSILDTRQGYWQERKKYWKELIGDNGESREDSMGILNVEYKEEKNIKTGFASVGQSVSILDPVLAEITNLWFGLDKCRTFDCFAGDSVFGYVSDAVGNTFTGIELRQEQTDLNNKRIRGAKSKYICDDGQNVLKHIKENSQDLLFSCPPYFDLEVYSDLENDASNQKEYKDFLQILDNAFTDAIKCLKDNRFAVITVGDIRDKKGFYYRFVDDIKDIFKKSNALLWNELILIEQIGTKALTAEKTTQTRKINKVHQNVLVFYKGDPKQIKVIYPKLDFSKLENTEDESTDV